MKNSANLPYFRYMLLFLFIGFSTTSCTAITHIKTNSKLDQSFPGQLDRLFLIYYTADDEETNFAKHFKTALLREAEKIGLGIQVLLRDPMLVESDKINQRKRLKEFDPTAVLRIKRTGWATSEGDIVEAKFKARIYKYSRNKIRKKIYWSGLFHVTDVAGFSLEKEDYESLGKQLISTLEKDGVI